MISPACKRRLEVQGYQGYTADQLSEYRFGIRFAYGLCTSLAALGLLLQSIPLLILTAFVALVGAVASRHPFDYIYNHVLRPMLRRPILPPRTAQGRFACGVAFVWLSLTTSLLYFDYTTAALAVGGVLVAVGTLVTTTDICIPSMVYNFMLRRNR